MDTKTRDQVRACLDGVATLVEDVHKDLFGPAPGAMLIPMRALLDHAEALMNGEAGARERKNAGDRARRAKKKSPGKRVRVKNPPHRPLKPLKPLSAKP